MTKFCVTRDRNPQLVSKFLFGIEHCIKQVKTSDINREEKLKKLN